MSLGLYCLKADYLASTAVLGISGSFKRIGGHDMAFQSHVTSSVTWPFDSPKAISYWWSFGTKPLSL